MRALLAIVITLMLGWSGWWWLAARTAQQAAEKWFTDGLAAGWYTSHAGIDVQGFPNRIDLTVTAPELHRRAAPWGWTAPFVQVLSLSYKPWHLIAAFAPEQHLNTPAGPATLHADRLQASVVLTPGRDLALERMQLAGDGLHLDGPLMAGIARLTAAMHPAVDRRNGWRFGVAAQEITVDPRIVALLPAGRLAAQAPIARLDAVATLSVPLDRQAIANPPWITALHLRELHVEWGDMRLDLDGVLKPDPAGYASGRLDLRLEGVATMLDLAVAGGLLFPDARQGWEKAIAAVSTQGQPLQLPLRLEYGQIMLGPMIIGPAPRLN